MCIEDLKNDNFKYNERYYQPLYRKNKEGITYS